MYCTKFYPISECKDLSVYNTILKCKKKCGDFKNKCNSRWKNVLDVNCMRHLSNLFKYELVSKTCRKTCNICGKDKFSL